MLQLYVEKTVSKKHVGKYKYKTRVCEKKIKHTYVKKQ